MRMPFRHRFTFAFLSFFSPTPLFADPSASLYTLPLEDLLNVQVITTSKYKENIQDSPGNLYVYSAKKIKQRGYQNITDLLQSLPGVHVQQFSILGPYNTVSFRGAMGNNKFLILQNGVRISSPGGEITAIGHNYPLYHAKQVEVLMGPASVVYGADAFMGVINIITHDSRSAKIEKNQHTLLISAGEDGYQRHNGNAHYRISDTTHLNLGAQRYNSQSLTFAEDFPDLYIPENQDHDFPDNTAQHAYIDAQLWDKWQLGINYATHTNSTDFTARPGFSSFSNDAVENIEQTSGYSRFSTQLFETLNSQTLLTAIVYELKNDSHFNNLFSGYSPGYKYAKTTRYSLNQDFDLQIHDKHLVSGGLVYDRFDTIPKGPDLPSPYDTKRSTTNQNLFYRGTTLPIEFFDQQYHNAGAYIQDNWSVNEKFRLVSGLRYDRHSIYGDELNPRISAIYRGDKKSLFKVLYGHAFLAPGPDQAFASFGSFTGAQNTDGEWLSNPFARFRVPNPDLNPERVKTLELSYENWLSDTTHIKVVPYLSKIHDVILLSNDETPDQVIPGASLIQTNKFENEGKSEIRGLDISIENTGSGDTWTTQNWLYLSYMDGSVDGPSGKSDLPMIANEKITAGSTLRYRDALQLTTKLFWVGKANSNRDPNTSEIVTVPSHFLMDVSGSYQLSQSMSFVLEIRNLFDRKYVHAPFPPAFPSYRVAPQPGRLMSVGLEFNF